MISCRGGSPISVPLPVVISRALCNRNVFSAEVTVLATQRDVDRIAERIERAYLLRRPFWHRGCSSPRAWTTAAEGLLNLHLDDPEIPLDPELYVASQPIQSDAADPWTDLTQPSSFERYRRCVQRIIRRLRTEVRRECRLANRQLRSGLAIEDILQANDTTLSPLSCYIIALHAGRNDLASRFRANAEAQHWSCPLYKQACAGWIKSEAYPAKERATTTKADSSTRFETTEVLRN